MNRVIKLGVSPNFYCAKPYLVATGAECFITGDNMWTFVLESVDGTQVCLFPPLPTEYNDSRNPCELFDEIWSTFNEHPVADCYQKTFLDYQFIYDQRELIQMKGPQYSTFRKNVRKWPARTGLRLEWAPLSAVPIEEVQYLCGYWIEYHQSDLQDYDTMLQYILAPTEGGNVEGLVDNYGVLRAIICWDGNNVFINFRYCITHPDEPFLEEYARLLFYQKSYVQANRPYRFVNDGGVVDSEGLEHFKDRLNPVYKLNTYSLKKV
jgi:hypothetical protein